ncbi:serine protease [Amycolatopsis sp. QT-25]|uniref:S1 family peptidase n=1 Tax=Amycolatopsis sp. QT-25 TaxID=3034022 RepID=UPI0023EE2082|nr:serine protease [Amycolatopsis sp. QT-25]WET76871.1 serine protease [Amycolatopsis sp. QT-25]
MPGLAGVSPATAADDVQPNLVGGREATGNTSWMASLQSDAPAYNRFNFHECGATVLFPNWVVTGAQCVTDMPGVPDRVPVSAKKFKVRVGSKDRTRGGETAKVVKIVVHPGWKWGEGAPGSKVSDVAMLKLDHPVSAQPLQLAGQAARAGDRIRLYGWGSAQPDGDPTNLPKKLQQLDTTVLGAAECAKGDQSEGEICTDNPHGTDGPGPGDSGSPAVAVVNGVPRLVGGCSRAAGARLPGVFPTIYTSTPEFRKWLYDTARGTPAA